jgi:hypothetical protein
MSRDHIAPPQTRLPINLVLEISIDAPQRRIAVNLFPQLSVSVDFASRGNWVGEAPHTYFYVNWNLKVSRILHTIEFIAFRPVKCEKAVLLLSTAIIAS